MKDGSVKTAKDSVADSRITLFEVEYELDLELCRRQMPFRIAELREADPDAGGVELVAKAASVDPKTLRTFLAGGRVTTEKLVDIVERGLALKLADVLQPVEAA